MMATWRGSSRPAGRSPVVRSVVPADGELYLAHWFDESEAVVRYLVVPFSPTLLARLEAGRMDLREALDQPRVWVVDVDDQGLFDFVAHQRSALLVGKESKIGGPSYPSVYRVVALAASHAFNDFWLSADDFPASKFSTLMSSSRAGQ